LANNHILDYQTEGMFDTFNSLTEFGIPFAGAGKNITEARKPAILSFCGLKMAVFSFADHYSYWAASENQPGINYINPEKISPDFYKEFAKTVQTLKDEQKVDLVMISIHWGSNYAWQPPKSFTFCAHSMIDQCHIDIIHAHSSHHVQGIEIYKKKIIIYGCGDFVDDYAVDKDYRNDLGFLYVAYLDIALKKWSKLELIPTRIKTFQVNKATGQDLVWLHTMMPQLCSEFGTSLSVTPEGHVVVEI